MAKLFLFGLALVSSWLSPLVFTTHYDHWCNLCRFTVVEVLLKNRLNKFLEMQRDRMKRLGQKLAQVSHNEFNKVDMKSRFSEMTFYTIMRVISGKRYWGDDHEVGDMGTWKKQQNLERW